MKSVLLLNHNENTKLIEEEEKNRFLFSLLVDMGIDLGDLLNSNLILDIEDKIKLRNILSVYNVRVIDDQDGHMQVYVDSELIGEWHKCEYKLKTDLSELDPKKKLYLEMSINYWSIFEETQNE